MRINNQQITFKPRSSMTIADHVRIKFHEQSGTALAYAGQLSGSDFSGSLTLGAAPTWERGGAKPPSSNTTCHAIATQAAHPILCDVLTPPVDGGLIFLWSYYQTAFTNNSSNSSPLLTFGNLGAAGDGYRVFFSQGANNNVGLGFRGLGAGAITQAQKVDNNLSVQKTVQMYLKTNAGALAGYTAIDGAWSTVGTAATTDAFSHTAPVNFNAAAIFVSLNTGPVVGTEYMNRGATDDKVLSDLLIVRDVGGDLFAKMAQIASEHGKYRMELPPSLRID